MRTTTFFEIILQTADFTFSGRDEIEDPLDEALQAAGLGEATGGGSGRGITNIDIEVTDTQRGLALIWDVLQTLRVAPSTIIRQSGSPALEHAAYDFST
ncbi:hypothetical protein SAMN02745166_02634 [Prosthecobacter debontii]|uniref:Uncharacterized protein n=1 Tax=Prosthecobacter debontii TaxID=48467 RepID=A0A1T4Y7S3_9BACT|nr:hypothetical protein [Prosthecobacter debontii]SKA97872.1 hypothetical protein SAMN02745166_02634 [Prosthecobacter debontii]